MVEIPGYVSTYLHIMHKAKLLLHVDVKIHKLRYDTNQG